VTKSRSFGLQLAAMLIHAPLATAETARQAYVPPETALSSGFQAVLGLVLVLGAIVLIAWLLRHFNLPRQAGGHQLKIIGGIAVGQRERVVIVEAGDTWLVLGVTAHNVRTLHTLPKGARQPVGEQHRSHGFQKWLNGIMEKRNAQ
jgi:flagellar protein FliO/FliZ